VNIVNMVDKYYYISSSTDWLKIFRIYDKSRNLSGLMNQYFNTLK